MDFSSILQQYMEDIHVTAGAVAEASGLSRSLISRYLSGTRLPIIDGSSLEKLASGLAQLAKDDKEAGNTDYTKETIRQELSRALSGIDIDYAQFCRNLRQLLSALSISHIDLSRALSYDPSYISRILSGQRHPGNPPRFLLDVSEYAARSCSDEKDIAALQRLTDSTPDEAADPVLRARVIRQYLGSNTAPRGSSISGFLTKLDEFDLNEYIREIRFEEMRTPTVPFQLPTTKLYYGIPEMMQAELDFLRAVVLSHSRERVIFYSDMPLMEMAADPEFPKKWMFGMAMLLRKGLQLEMIHDVHRPFEEMILGLSSWIPMYMTGQLSPHYLPNATGHTFLHFIRSAGSVAVAGEAIAGNQANGRYTVTKRKEDVAYYRQRAEDLLKRAKPLMEIYRQERAEEFMALFPTMLSAGGNYRYLCGVPPLFCMAEERLRAILIRHEVEESMIAGILQHRQELLSCAEKALEDGEMTLEIPLIDLSTESKALLPLSSAFVTQPVFYTPEEYRQHVEDTKAFAETHPRCSLMIPETGGFRNVQIIVCRGRFALISKCNQPPIHFLIRYPLMVQALENFAEAYPI